MIVFTCNHCPYALAWHDRIAEAARDYADRGVRFLAINANDAERYPRDSYEAMQRRVARRGLADALPARCDPGGRAGLRREDDARTCSCSTPRGALRYRGAPDADYDDPAQNAQWLREALDARPGGRRRRPARRPGRSAARSSGST